MGSWRRSAAVGNGHVAALRSLLESREAEIRRLQRMLDLYQEAERHKEAEMQRVLERLRRLAGSVCRGHYLAEQLSGEGWGRLEGMGALDLCAYIERSVLEEYQRLEAEAAQLRAALAAAELKALRLAQEGPPRSPSPDPGVRSARPRAEAALPEAPPVVPPTVQRVLQQLGEEERAALLDLARSGVCRLTRLRMDERTRERLVTLGVLDASPLQLFPGRTGDGVVRLGPVGAAVLRALGAEPVPDEVSRWESWYAGDVARGYLLAELADAWAEAGYTTELDPERAQVLGEAGRLVVPHAVVRGPEGQGRYVWLVREGDEIARLLRDAVAASTDPCVVGTTREVCRAVQQEFTELALREPEVARRAVVLWLASFEQALKRQFKPVPSGPAAAQRLRRVERGGEPGHAG